MSIVKVPKKLRDVFALMRKGDIDAGIQQLETIKGFEPQKNIALAEIAYFLHDYERAMMLDEQALPFHEQWYAGNVLTEHFFAYTRAAVACGKTSKAAGFYQNFLEKQKANNLPEHRVKMFAHQVDNHTKKLQGATGLPIDKEPHKLITNGDPLETFVAQLHKYRPKLAFDSVMGAEYILHFMHNKANTADFFSLYETHSHNIVTGEHHLNAAKLHHAAGNHSAAKKALMRFATKTWYPVEAIQVAPMCLWEYDDLQPLLSADFCKEILHTPKAQ